MADEHATLFTDPDIQYPRLTPDLRFHDYIQQCIAIIKNNRIDLQNNAEHIVQANAPFERYPDQIKPGQKIKYGVLLIHGLLDSPVTFRDIAQTLPHTDCLIRAVLLPGHGTLPGALLSVTYQQWIETVAYGVETLAQEVDQIVLIGYSTGGSLALHYASTHPGKIAGIITLAPAIKIKSFAAFFAHLPPKMSGWCSKAAWFRQDKNELSDYARYRSITYNAVYQVYLLSNLVRALPQPDCPLFFVIPANDGTVSSQTTLNYFKKNTHANSRLLIYSNKKTSYEDKRIMLKTSSYPDKSIFDFSHATLPFSPHNSYYGEQGQYVDASHVNDKNKPFLYGEYYIPLMKLHNRLYHWKLCRYQHQRLSFNPDFDFLSRQIGEFITSCLQLSSIDKLKENKHER